MQLVLSLWVWVTVKVLCGFVLLFQEILSQVILSVVYISVCWKRTLLPVAVIHFPLNWRKMGWISSCETWKREASPSTKTARERTNNTNVLSVINLPLGSCHWELRQGALNYLICKHINDTAFNCRLRSLKRLAKAWGHFSKASTFQFTVLNPHVQRLSTWSC